MAVMAVVKMGTRCGARESLARRVGGERVEGERVSVVGGRRGGGVGKRDRVRGVRAKEESGRRCDGRREEYELNCGREGGDVMTSVQGMASRRRVFGCGVAAAFTCIPASAFAISSSSFSPPLDETGKFAKLSFDDISTGDGAEVVSGQVIKADYTGLLTSGKQFDSSRGKRPLIFRVGAGEVIKGWDIGIIGNEASQIPPMKVGGTRILFIPSELAYGARGAGRGLIPPNSDLIFEVKLLGIVSS